MTIIPLDRTRTANGASGGTPALEARGLTKHFPVHRGARRSVVHAVEDVTLALPRAGWWNEPAPARCSARRGTRTHSAC